ncbi:MAG: hypothetical protein HRU82_12485 [Nitrospira sp.]|nr:MAG: hypothetical protein HRU82_12485 [Nitrospira sp.]
MSNNRMRFRYAENERGVALLAVLMVVFLMTLLGLTSAQLAGQEMIIAGALHEERLAQHAVDAAVDVVTGWFHDPALVPHDIASTFLAKRTANAQGAPSYVDAQGRSQFIGTAEQPDLVFDAAVPAQDRLLNDPLTGWFRSLKGLARILKLRVYGPTRPGLLCTVEVMAGAGRVTKSVAMELGAYAIPSLHAPIQTGALGSDVEGSRPGSVTAHWGDLVVRGHAYLSRADEIPAKSSLASVTGQSYAEMGYREDRWVDLWIGGEVFFSQVPSETKTEVPANVHVRQMPVPGIKMDQWEYEALKRMAKQFGRYYGIDRDGFLYLGGVIQPGSGIRAAEVFASSGVGNHQGLVFIDTLDAQPPRADNLGTIVLDQEYAEGMFVVNAHVHWRVREKGQSVPALSPPPEGETSLGTRVPAQLSDIHLQGVLYTAGDLRYAGHVKIYGGIAAQGALVDETNGFGALEVWFNHELRDGFVQGVPVVFQAPGSRQVRIM